MTGNRKLFAPDRAVERIDQFACIEERGIAAFAGNMNRFPGDRIPYPAAMDRDGRVRGKMTAVKNIVLQGIRSDLTGLFQPGFRSGRITFQSSIESIQQSFRHIRLHFRIRQSRVHDRTRRDMVHRAAALMQVQKLRSRERTGMMIVLRGDPNTDFGMSEIVQSVKYLIQMMKIFK